MNIFVTNDDGIDSPGIYALVKEMRKLGNVYVVAPDRQQSAVGHALTVSKPLRATKFHRDGEMFGYAINGTPADCVKLAITSLLDHKPDLIVSGINHGQNTSINVIYSGTVSAATEGMLLGIPSIAVSHSSYSYEIDCTIAAEYALKISKNILENPLPNGTLLNINVPNLLKDEIKGIKVTRLSKSYWIDHYDERIDPFGRKYYWFAGEFKTPDEPIDTDDTAVLNGYVSVTPIHFDFTNSNFIDKLKIIET
jgi:5'-nucleotidase